MIDIFLARYIFERKGKLAYYLFGGSLASHPDERMIDKGIIETKEITGAPLLLRADILRRNTFRFTHFIFLVCGSSPH